MNDPSNCIGLNVSIHIISLHSYTHHSLVTSSDQSNLSNDVLKTLKKVDEMILSNNPPIDLFINQYPFHYSIQVMLRDCHVISYIMHHNECMKLYIDDSINSSIENRVQSCDLSSNHAFLALEDNQLLAIVNSQRDKCKRPYISANKSLMKHINSHNSHSQCPQLSFNSSHTSLALHDYQYLTIYDLKHETIELAAKLVPVSTEKQQSHHHQLMTNERFTLRQDVQFLMIPHLTYQSQHYIWYLYFVKHESGDQSQSNNNSSISW